jgi:maltoporin
MIKKITLKKMLNVSGESKKSIFLWSPLVAILLGATSVTAQATDVGGLEISGYTRGGVVFNEKGTPRGGYTLGGDMQKYRLGNEGDNGFEIELRKTFDLGDGVKWSMDFMPTVWNGTTGTQQGYAEMTGLDFAPSAKFWAGQRRLRIQDVHIVDHFFMDYGLNFGVGMTDLDLGVAKLGVGMFNGGSFDNKNSLANNARRLNIDVSQIKTNAGGVVRILGSVINGDFADGSPGSSLGISHNQSNFIFEKLTNTFFAQTANGHAAMNGQFKGLATLDTTGALLTADVATTSSRFGDSINWQSGPFGGQALVALQNDKAEASGTNTKDFTLGGRISYAFSRNFKMLAEAGSTTRDVDNQAQQVLNKITIAPTLAVGSDFWSRPELRFYVTHATWNDAAALANVATFGANGKTSATTAGVQMEVWW